MSSQKKWQLPWSPPSAAPPFYSSQISKLHHGIKNIAPGNKQIYEEAQTLTLALNTGRVLVSPGEQTEGGAQEEGGGRRAEGGQPGGERSSEQHDVFSKSLLFPPFRPVLWKAGLLGQWNVGPLLISSGQKGDWVGTLEGIQRSSAQWMTSDKIFSMTRTQKTLAQSQTIRFAERVYILSVSPGCSKPIGRCCLYLLSLLTWLPPRSFQGLGLSEINRLLAHVTKKLCGLYSLRERLMMPWNRSAVSTRREFRGSAVLW